MKFKIGDRVNWTGGPGEYEVKDTDPRFNVYIIHQSDGKGGVTAMVFENTITSAKPQINLTAALKVGDTVQHKSFIGEFEITAINHGNNTYTIRSSGGGGSFSMSNVPEVDLTPVQSNLPTGTPVFAAGQNNHLHKKWASDTAVISEELSATNTSSFKKIVCDCGGHKVYGSYAPAHHSSWCSSQQCE